MAPGSSDSAATTASRRELRRQQHHELSRNQLLDAAEEVFGAKGFHDTTLKQVAELAEYSVGSVYSFFDSKEDLFLQVFLRRGSELLPAMDEIVRSDDPALDQLRALVELEVDFFRRHRHFARLYLRSSPSTSLPPLSVYEGFRANFQRAMELQARVFRRGQERGELRGGDPVVLARMLSGIVATYQLLDPATGSDDALPGSGMPLDDLHEIVAGAFRRP
jgi:TetR/AcrR family transcriptional regulator